MSAKAKGPVNAKIELEGERVTPSLAEAWDVVAKTGGSLLEELLQIHRDEILKCWVDSGGNEYALTAGINFKGAANAPLVKLKLSWTTKYSDEASEQVDDGTQTKLPLDEDPEEAAEAKRRYHESQRRRQTPLLQDVTPAPEPGEPLALEDRKEGEIVDATFEMVEETPDVDPLTEILGEDELKAVEIIKAEGEISTGLVQRKLCIGFMKAKAILEALYNKGVVAKSSPPVKWAMVAEIAKEEEGGE